MTRRVRRSGPARGASLALAPALALALIAAVGARAGAAAAVPSAPVPSCAGAEHRRLDFWAGDWDAFDVGGSDKPAARARVEVILGGCALRETYESANGLVGESYTAYDATRKVWHQTWVTNRGTLLMVEGNFQGPSLILEGPHRFPSGREGMLRGVWTPEADAVREVAHTSEDGGKTWEPLFDIRFRPHRKGGTPMAASAARSADQETVETVAALDTQYQAAVAKNDAATMDRILADGFILVTGKGKVYTKADLLAEARGGKTVYERQHDSRQTVRVFGDTAVITALLHAKGTEEGKPFEYEVWFSDTYVRTAAGWRYVFGQSATRL